MSDMKIELTQVLHGIGGKARASGQQSAAYSVKPRFSINTPESEIQADKAHAPSGRLAVRNSLYTMVAKHVRSFDMAIHTISDYIERMKEQLETFVKHYPPYPPGSEERVRLLRSFQAFRRQIDQLTIPRPKRINNRGMPFDHSAVSSADDQASIEHSVNKLEMLRQKIEEGIECLNIPELSETAGNPAMYSALRHFGNAAEDMAQLKYELQKGASEIFTFLEGFEGIQSTGGVCAFQGITETNAESKSTEIKMTLFHEIKTGLTRNPGQLLESCI
ncbi:MAG: hypothetical protein ACMUIA_03825 [bacterium]